ncbi:unnamed protein product [Lota lota]
MDREARQEYDVVIQAKDMGGHMGGLSGTTEVKITLTDVNDNPPKFPQSVYTMSVSEDKVSGEEVGRLKAKDPDQGENGLVSYRLTEGDGLGVFELTTDSQSREAVIKLKKLLDYQQFRQEQLTITAVMSCLLPSYFQLCPPLFCTALFVLRMSLISSFSPPRYILSYLSLSLLSLPPLSLSSLSLFSLSLSLLSFSSLYPSPPSSSLSRFSLLSLTLPLISYPYPRFMDTKVRVNIRVKDVNDNAPEFATNNEILMCETITPGKVIETVSAVDKDEMAHRQHFTFSLAPEIAHNHNFSLKDNRDSTASIHVLRKGFSRLTQDVYFLPIEISDNGVPSLSSTNTLTVRVCSCDSKDTILSCNVEPYVLPAGLSTGALIAILACIVILLAIVVLFVALRRQKKEPLIVFEEEDIRENIITYDDEGGGEEDTEAFDIATLQNPDGANGFLPRKDIKPELQYPMRPGPGSAGGNSVDVDDFIKSRIAEADGDPTAPPYDSIQIYGYEGRGSVAGSLSSLESVTTESDLDYDYLQSWGPRFKRLADLYGTKDYPMNDMDDVEDS